VDERKRLDSHEFDATRGSCPGSVLTAQRNFGHASCRVLWLLSDLTHKRTFWQTQRVTSRLSCTPEIAA